MRKPLLTISLVLLASLSLLTNSTAQSDQSDRPKLNRHPSPPNATPTPDANQSPTPTASPSPNAGAAQPEADAKPSYPDLLPHYSYDPKTPLDIRETNVEKRGDVMVIELNYAGAEGDRVPAYLLVPHGNGPFAGIVWGHWLKPGSSMANKDEFLEEALALAHSGVVSVLIDAPQVRHGYTKEKGPIDVFRQAGEAGGHEVIDLRRAVDLLYSRRNVDHNRIAYVGHSFNAHTGAILAGVETRICCFVLMAGEYSEEEATFASKDPKILAYRKQIGDDTLRDFFREYAWDDPAYFLGHTNEESVFLQFASGDPISKDQAQKYLDMFNSKDKKMEYYDASHALNAAARLDRDRWLQKHLNLKKLDEKLLDEIPQLQ
jgi:dienelactone hydrolase